MTINVYSPMIKADLDDLLSHDPDYWDILQFVLHHVDLDDLVNLLGDEVNDYIVSRLEDKSDKSKEYRNTIQALYWPEEVFTWNDLDRWAKDHGYIKKENE